MKNIMTLLLAILFSAGMAFAQNGNQATIDQTGDQHEAGIDQRGDLNQAFVVQSADAGREGSDVASASIEQEGSSNFVNLRQRAFYGDNEATIVQIGSNNKVQGPNNGDVFKQNHGLNILDVRMEGNNNTLYGLRVEAQKNINVLELDVNGSDNLVGILQEFGLANVDIEGSHNDVVVNQKTNAGVNTHITNIGILGNLNVVDVKQRGALNRADISIDGWSNTTIIEQRGIIDGGDNIFELDQFGDGNTVGDKNSPFIQDGEGNRFRGVSEDNGDLSYDWTTPAEQNNGATLDFETEGIAGYYGSFQKGDDNRIGLRQGMDDWALIQQLGDSNTALLYQFGVDRNEATILQNGDGNQASVFQTN